ncbi:unnamed protein product [Periconia digitata]|uniref:Uncharacterized protein n=1 Tax=Periconia digitata TaxID=1303443 RepID=A0A9W4U2A4_9PLEO|nr:unnamed protein product [Periconia digitata]
MTENTGTLRYRSVSPPPIVLTDHNIPDPRSLKGITELKERKISTIPNSPPQTPPYRAIKSRIPVPSIPDPVCSVPRAFRIRVLFFSTTFHPSLPFEAHNPRFALSGGILIVFPPRFGSNRHIPCTI